MSRAPAHDSSSGRLRSGQPSASRFGPRVDLSHSYKWLLRRIGYVERGRTQTAVRSLIMTSMTTQHEQSVPLPHRTGSGEKGYSIYTPGKLLVSLLLTRLTCVRVQTCILGHSRGCQSSCVQHERTGSQVACLVYRYREQHARRMRNGILWMKVRSPSSLRSALNTSAARLSRLLGLRTSPEALRTCYSWSAG
jgi:hypothetical protein